MKQIYRKILLALLGGALIFCNLSAKSIHSVNSITENKAVLFVDISESDWFYDSVYTCHESGIFMGDNANQFHPLQKITAPESYAILARLHQHSVGDNTPLVAINGESWSEPYLTYCIEHNIMSQVEATNYKVLSRELFACFLSRIYDVSLFEKINPIIDIVDYDISGDLGTSILSFYQSGIFSGIDTYGSFSPLTELSRAECATIITRLLYPEKRITTPENANPLKMELNLESNVVYDFDGKYIYLVDLSDEENPIYYVSDLYGRKILSGSKRISRAQYGIFSCYDDEVNQTSFYNTTGALIYQSFGLSDYSFRYGKLATNQGDGSILIINSHGEKISRFDCKGVYRVIGASFGDYIPVAPNENQNQDHSYWLNTYTGTVVELPYTIAFMLNRAQDFIVVRAYNESNGAYSYNAIDTSLNTLFSENMASVQVLGKDVVLAEDDINYYILQSGEAICSYSKAQYGKIEQFSLGNRVLQRTIDGKTKISNLKTGEIYASFPDIDTYLIVGRKVTRPRNVNGTTVIDLFDEYGNMEQEGIHIENIWYGDMGQILYRVDNQYFYISE